MVSRLIQLACGRNGKPFTAPKASCETLVLESATIRLIKLSTIAAQIPFTCPRGQRSSQLARTTERPCTSCHWTGHPSRLNRETLRETYRFGDPSYAREELRAELASLFLMAERGIPHDPERHASYLNSWFQKWRARHFSSNHQQLIM